MKKIILLFVAISYISIAATTKSSVTHHNGITLMELEAAPEKYKDCINACNACVAACAKCETECVKLNAPKMDRCIQLCRETASVCAMTSRLMTLNSDDVKAACNLAATIADKCAMECEKFDQEDCKECAKACREASKECKAI